MSTSTLAISCLTTFNLPWFTDLTFQVPTQYSLWHRTLLPSPVISTNGCSFHFGSASSFFLELFIHSTPVAYWAPTDLGSSSFTITSFCLLIQFSRVLNARILKWLAIFFSSVPRFCQNSPPWPNHLGWPYTAWLIVFIELDKAVIQVISLVSFL